MNDYESDSDEYYGPSIQESNRDDEVFNSHNLLKF